MKKHSGSVGFLACSIVISILFCNLWALGESIFSETFEGAFPSANGWYVGDNKPEGPRAFWGRVNASFGWEGTHGGDWKGYCAGVGYSGKTTRPSYQNTMSSFMWRFVNLESYASASLSFWYKIPSVENGSYDKLRVLIEDKQFWVASTPEAGQDWKQVTVNMDELAGSDLVKLEFRFTSDSGGVAEGAYLDDIVVEGVLLPDADTYEPDDEDDDAKAIGNGEKQYRSLFPIGNKDWAKFTVPFGASNVWIETDGPTGDTQISLYGPDEHYLSIPGGYDNNDGNGLFSRLVSGVQGMPVTLCPGTYYIRVNELGDDATIPAYTLSATWTDCPPSSPAPDVYEPDNKAANASYISNGKRQRRNIHKAGNTDWAYFTTDFRGAKNVVIETDGASGDTQLWLYGPNSSSTQVAYDDDSGIENFSKITWPYLSAGTYFIKVTEFGNNKTIPAYTLRATWKNIPITPDIYEPDDTRADAKPIGNGEMQYRNLHTDHQIDYVKFTVGSKGARNVVIENNDTSGELWLQDHSGVLLADVVYPEDGDDSLRITMPFLAAGTYYIVVVPFHHESSPIPAYALRARWTNL